MNSELFHLIQNAIVELKSLRSELQVLRAQNFVVEAFHAALLGPPRPSGVSPDIVWQLEKQATMMLAEDIGSGDQ